MPSKACVCMGFNPHGILCALSPGTMCHLHLLGWQAIWNASAPEDQALIRCAFAIQTRCPATDNGSRATFIYRLAGWTMADRLAPPLTPNRSGWAAQLGRYQNYRTTTPLNNNEDRTVQHSPNDLWWLSALRSLRSVHGCTTITALSRASRQ